MTLPVRDAELWRGGNGQFPSDRSCPGGSRCLQTPYLRDHLCSGRRDSAIRPDWPLPGYSWMVLASLPWEQTQGILLLRLRAGVILGRRARRLSSKGCCWLV